MTTKTTKTTRATKAYQHPELALGRTWDPEEYCGLDWGQCYPILDGEGTIIGVLDGDYYDHARHRHIDPEAEGLEFDEERECWQPAIEITDEDLQLLGRFCERDEDGTHFTAKFSPEWLDKMEQAGLIQITRPVHDTTGIPYSQEYWHAQVTPAGIQLGEERDWGGDEPGAVAPAEAPIAILTHNNAYDTVLVANGSNATVPVDTEVFRAFFGPVHGAWEDWGGGEPWTEHGSSIREAAKAYGEVVAFWTRENRLVVANRARWAERKGFYGVTKVDPKEV